LPGIGEGGNGKVAVLNGVRRICRVARCYPLRVSLAGRFTEDFRPQLRNLAAFNSPRSYFRAHATHLAGVTLLERLRAVGLSGPAGPTERLPKPAACGPSGLGKTRVGFRWFGWLRLVSVRARGIERLRWSRARHWYNGDTNTRLLIDTNIGINFIPMRAPRLGVWRVPR
jgi:hypothetical protein